MPTRPGGDRLATIASHPSSQTDSSSSGIGENRLDHTRNASISTFSPRRAALSPAFLMTVLAQPQAKDAAITIRNGPIAAPCARSAAKTPMPAKAMAAPRYCNRLGRSPSRKNASPKVKNTCNCITSEVRPAGMPNLTAENTSPNFTTPSRMPKAASAPHPVAGRAMKNTAGRAVKKNRNAVRNSGGISSTPSLIATKFVPQTATTSRIHRVSRRDKGTSNPVSGRVES